MRHAHRFLADMIRHIVMGYRHSPFRHGWWRMVDVHPALRPGVA